MRIQPFRALHPPPHLAADVASLPYDVGELADARAEAAAHPKSFLHVERPEVDLPDRFPEDADHLSAARHLEKFRQEGWLVQDAAPSLYLYRIRLGSHAQTGLIACCHIEDYAADVIKKHEKTKKPVEDQRTRHVLVTGANTGPIFLLYKDRPDLLALQENVASKSAPMFDFTARDGIRHTVWQIPDAEPFIRAMEQVPVAYIADGHHRAASAARAGRERAAANPAHRGDEEYNWFLSVLFPASHLNILPYNRHVKDLNGRTPAGLLSECAQRFHVEKRADALPIPQSGRVHMYLERHWYELSWNPDPKADPVSAMDVSVLQDRLLGPVLGIDDPRTNSRIGYLGGPGCVEELKRRVDTGAAAVAFSVHPTTVRELMAISDAGQIMPPKSTWFEPKLRSGLFVHLLD